jgi:hypothetical protein
MKAHVVWAVLTGVLVSSSVAGFQRSPAVVAGRVTDTRGMVLDGVRVSFRSVQGDRVGPVETAGGGLYSLSCPRQDYGVLIVQADGFRTLEEPAFCGGRPDDSRRDVTLSLGDLPNAAGASAVGVVKDEAGVPVNDASVWVTGLGTSQLRRDARSLADGSYQAEFPAGGDFVVLCATKPIEAGLSGRKSQFRIRSSQTTC